MKGKLIAFEGIDGAGKSTIAKQLVDALRRKGHDTILTREPWSPRWREAVCSGDVWASTADRAAHMHEVVWPALERGIHVVTDRFYLSCAAYAHYGPKDGIFCGQEKLFGTPDLWVWLDTDPEVALERIKARGEWERHGTLEKLQALRREIFNLWPYCELARLQVCCDEPMGQTLPTVLQIIERAP